MYLLVSVAQKTGGQRRERTERGGREEREMEIRGKEQRREGNLLQVSNEYAISTQHEYKYLDLHLNILHTSPVKQI